MGVEAGLWNFVWLQMINPAMVKFCRNLDYIESPNSRQKKKTFELLVVEDFD